ncbi:hypothetical protein ONS95_002158 [Cadophora gregata]|uniref:uncharacterized protein n=1 Tax=Cadophora gregata TaxID=51156 RepID=UPI0026DD006E|nr:uncharacterized protein ONS95_002158 [Cadophora gregata]KAK0109465.1 hypothetical protein ONS95_002158 [Cadophora gregata]KAK0110906.1 hypothetical protein ONS96_002492 [Cadophora gregata f. sp. sojae]
MFAVRDQENLVHGHQQAAAVKPLNQSTRGLQPKTPGAKYPKTPLKIPLNDENAPAGFGGKSVKGKGLEALMTGKKGATFDKNAFVTPMGPRTRAPLGMKTTNAKAKAFQTPSGPAPEKELEKTQPKQQTSARRPKKLIHADSVKLEVHGDESPLADRDVEYCPPRTKDLPYESTDFPDNCLDYTALKPGNLMRGINKTYRQQVDENGMSRIEREAEEAYQRSAKATDERMMKMMEEDWTVGDVPETFRHLRNKKTPLSIPQDAKPASRKPLTDVKKPVLQNKGPGTINARKAASVLSSAPLKSAPLQPKISKPAPKPSFLSRSKPSPAPVVPNNASTMRAAAANAASRSTIGYTKGRSASGILNMQTFAAPPTSNITSTSSNNDTTTAGAALPKPERTQRVLQRSTSNMSTSSEITITPARWAKESEAQAAEWRNPAFMKAFEVEGGNEDECDAGLGSGGLDVRGLQECLRREEEEDGEFVMVLGGGA